MDSLQVRTGQISLRILDDEGNERGVFRFNPEDIESAKQFMALQDEVSQKKQEFDERAQNATTPEEQVELLSETVTYFKGLIDQCFGEGSSETLFGNANTLSMFTDFFEGIAPYYSKASKKRIGKYNTKAAK